LTPATMMSASDILATNNVCNWEVRNELRVYLVGWFSSPPGALGDLHWRICVNLCCANAMDLMSLWDNRKSESESNPSPHPRQSAKIWMYQGTDG
jgi:hypothetical protein